MGTDAWSWDAPFIHTRQKFMETGAPAGKLSRPLRFAASNFVRFIVVADMHQHEAVLSVLYVH